MTTNQWVRTIKGWGVMSESMYAVLTRLIEAEDEGNPWVDLDDVFHTTRSALCRKDWAVESPGLDGVRYKVTGRGRKAYAVFSTPTEMRRWDGICPRCGLRPKAVTANGHKLGYCEACASEAKKRNYQLRGDGWHHDAERLCPDCGLRPVHVTANGHVHPYCRECKNRRSRQEHRLRNERKRQRIQAGEHIGCVTCGAPVYYSENWVYDYCQEHYRQMQQKSRRRTSWRKVVQRER